jgi:hypothetical protein
MMIVAIVLDRFGTTRARPVAATTFLLWSIRDMATIGGSFALPAKLAPVLQKQFGTPGAACAATPFPSTTRMHARRSSPYFSKPQRHLPRVPLLLPRSSDGCTRAPNLPLLWDFQMLLWRLLWLSLLPHPLSPPWAVFPFVVICWCGSRSRRHRRLYARGHLTVLLVCDSQT